MSVDMLTPIERSQIEVDGVSAALSSIFVNDRWIWELTGRPDGLWPAMDSSPGPLKVEKAVFRGFLGRFASLFQRLVGGSALANLTRARVLSTALFISLGDRESVVWIPAANLATSFKRLYACPLLRTSRRAFVRQQVAFTKALMAMNHRLVMRKATQIASRRYHYIKAHRIPATIASSELASPATATDITPGSQVKFGTADTPSRTTCGGLPTPPSSAESTPEPASPVSANQMHQTNDDNKSSGSNNFAQLTPPTSPQVTTDVGLFSKSTHSKSGCVFKGSSRRPPLVSRPPYVRNSAMLCPPISPKLENSNFSSARPSPATRRCAEQALRAQTKRIQTEWINQLANACLLSFASRVERLIEEANRK